MSLPKPSLLRFKFEDFENLPSEPGKKVYSEKVNDCHGNSWNLKLYPGGVSVSDDPSVSLYLRRVGKCSSIVVRPHFILRDVRGKSYYECTLGENSFELAVRGWGFGDFLKRSIILNETNGILVGGALIVDAHLQFMPEPNSLQMPSSTLNKILKLFENGEGDVSFKVGDEVITAHKFILQINAPVLFNSCEEHNDGSPIPINDTTPDIFRIVLRYVHGEEVPGENTIKAKGKMIIDAANKFGAVDLKIAVETALVQAFVIELDNVAGWLLFADAKACPLLKEQAIAYFTSRSVDILNSVTSKKLKESPRLLTELISAVATSANKDNCFEDEQLVSVGDLRKRLREKGLDVDGSKEMLMSRLQESNKRQRVE